MFERSLTCGKIVELLALQTQRFLVTEQVGIVQGGLVHELQRLRD